MTTPVAFRQTEALPAIVAEGAANLSKLLEVRFKSEGLE